MVGLELFRKWGTDIEERPQILFLRRLLRNSFEHRPKREDDCNREPETCANSSVSVHPIRFGTYPHDGLPMGDPTVMLPDGAAEMNPCFANKNTPIRSRRQLLNTGLAIVKWLKTHRQMVGLELFRSGRFATRNGTRSCS